MPRKKYKVTGPFETEGHKPGEEFSADLDPGIVELHFAAGSLAYAKDAETDKAEKLACPACSEQGMKRPPRFDDLAGLHEHYADKHPGLVAPATEEEVA